MAVPSSIERIEPLPAIAVALLNRLPLEPAEVRDLQASLGIELLNSASQVVLASGVVAAENADPRSVLEQISPARFAEIATTILIRDYLKRAFTFSGDRRYWRYTLACAICCAELAPPGEDHGILAYASGLLHDIGRLALIAAYPDKYSNLLALADRMFATEQPFDILEYERMLFGFDHFAAGAWLAATWKLPPWLLAIVGRFHDQASSEHRTLVATVRAGTRLAHSIGFGYLEAAPRAHIRDILRQLPAAWEHWKVLDRWQYGEEHMRAKIQSQLNWYADPYDSLTEP
ncbi:MAG: HDOD domain-containing protein [Acidobacteriia bacterium]|nr:HDOD domain-containing protein [Terriglobia bacterium]